MKDKRVTILLGAVAAIALAGAAVDGAATAGVLCRLRSVDKAAYVAKNEALLRHLPVFPGAKLVASYSIGQTATDTCLPVANGTPYGSFTTTHAYETAGRQPPGTLVRYYKKRLLAQGWRWVARSGLAGPSHDSTFRRGPALLYISESNDRRAAWIVTADHAAYSRLKPRR
jgi:hypothetical protein